MATRISPSTPLIACWSILANMEFGALIYPPE